MVRTSPYTPSEVWMHVSTQNSGDRVFTAAAMESAEVGNVVPGSRWQRSAESERSRGTFFLCFLSEPGSPAFLEMGASTLNLSNEWNFCMKPFKNGFDVTSEKEWEFQGDDLLRGQHNPAEDTVWVEVGRGEDFQVGFVEAEMCMDDQTGNCPVDKWKDPCRSKRLENVFRDHHMS